MVKDSNLKSNTSYFFSPSHFVLFLLRTDLISALVCLVKLRYIYSCINLIAESGDVTTFATNLSCFIMTINTVKAISPHRNKRLKVCPWAQLILPECHREKDL